MRAVTTPSGQAWLREAVDIYRRAGFFADRASAETAIGEAQVGISAILDDERERMLWGDRYLMELDESRASRIDPEDAVFEGENSYREIITEWIALVGDDVALGDVSEEWRSEDGPVDISLEINGRRATITATAEGNWL